MYSSPGDTFTAELFKSGDKVGLAGGTSSNKVSSSIDSYSEMSNCSRGFEPERSLMTALPPHEELFASFGESGENGI